MPRLFALDKSSAAIVLLGRVCGAGNIGNMKTDISVPDVDDVLPIERYLVADKSFDMPPHCVTVELRVPYISSHFLLPGRSSSREQSRATG